MAYRREETKEERKRREHERKRLVERYGEKGIVEVVPVTRRFDPFIEGSVSLERRKKAEATSLPVRVYEETGGTHPVSGMPEVRSKVIDFSIWPVAGRTDQAGDIGHYMRPIELLHYFADPKKGWGRLYRFKRVEDEVLEAERKTLQNPGSRKSFEDMQRDGILQRNASDDMQERTKRASVPTEPRLVAVRAVPEDLVEDADDVDSYAEFSDEEMQDADESGMSPEEIEEQRAIEAVHPELMATTLED